MAEKKINETQDNQILLAKASAKSIKISPQKANLVLGLIRGLEAEEALNVLEFSNKRISNEIKKILKSAISNAENNHQLDIDKLVVHEALVGKSMVMKRFRPRARGRSGKILKPFSKIKIILKEQQESKDNPENKQKLSNKIDNSVEVKNKNISSNENNSKIEKVETKEDVKKNVQNEQSDKDSLISKIENNNEKGKKDGSKS
jgi:large subunit ribosomal protein L22